MVLQKFFVSSFLDKSCVWSQNQHNQSAVPFTVGFSKTNSAICLFARHPASLSSKKILISNYNDGGFYLRLMSLCALIIVLIKGIYLMTLSDGAESFSVNVFSLD